MATLSLRRSDFPDHFFGVLPEFCVHVRQTQRFEREESGFCVIATKLRLGERKSVALIVRLKLDRGLNFLFGLDKFLSLDHQEEAEHVMRGSEVGHEPDGFAQLALDLSGQFAFERHVSVSGFGREAIFLVGEGVMRQETR